MSAALQLDLTATNTDAPISFLRDMHPHDLWVLTALDPENGAIETRSFSPDREEEARVWIKQRLGTKNLYWGVNPPLRSLNKKSSREDIKEVNFLHVDIDPLDDEPLAQEQLRIRSLLCDHLPAGVPPPTVIVFSGGGFQAYWKLTQPMPIKGELALADDAARYNKALELAFGADSCHDISRIMRIAGTWNNPAAKKVAKGRVRALAHVVEADWSRVYPITDFTPVPKQVGEPAGATVQIGEAVQRIADVSELDRWHVPDRLKAIIVQGDDVDSPKPRDNSRSAWLHDAVCNLIRCGVPDEVIYAVITDQDFGISGSVLEKRSKAKEYAIRQIAKAKSVVAKDAPGAVAAKAVADAEEDEKPTPTMLAQWWLDRRRSRLIRYDGEWLAYDSGAYLAREDEGVRSEVWKAYPKANSAIVSNIMDAAKGLIHLDKNTFAPPCWMDTRQQPQPDKLIVLRNGILDLDAGVLMPHTDQMFTRNALDFDYDPNAPKPVRFFQFLNEVWPELDELDFHTTLQQMFGYLLVPDTSHQKIFVMVGPPRCGKGTVGRLLGRILGKPNVCSPTFTSMGKDFGKQSMLGKQLALITDMRIGRNTDKAAVAETLLTISGEDNVTVQRKFLDDWNGRLGVRFVILSNEPPTLDDPSGALLSRYIILEMRQSFLGKEDLTLDDQLAGELPGILNWAIDGWKALQQAGRFVQPANAADMVDSISRNASPIWAFVQDECDLDPAATVDKNELFTRFKAWCGDQGRDWHGNKETFSKGLLVSCRGVWGYRKRGCEKRKPVYGGLKLKPTSPTLMSPQLDLGPEPF